VGIPLGDIIPRRKIDFAEIAGKKIAIDAFNALYQFLSIIRGADGNPLMDSEGRVTSHLSGLLYRNTNLAEMGIRPCYVFDGAPPKLKRPEIVRREEVKQAAAEKLRKAIDEGRTEEIRKYAQATARLTHPMISDAQRLLSLMGIPWIQAPSEGEAQAAHMAARGDVYAAASQDYDSLLFGAPVLIRNVTISGRRKIPRKNAYVQVEPEIVELQTVLDKLKLNRNCLVYLGILIGTDYNPDGIKGIGPKTALKMVTQYGSLQDLLEHIGDKNVFPVDPEELVKLFLEPDVTDRYELSWASPDVDGIVSFLCRERGFSEERVRKALDKMQSGLNHSQGHSTLEKWFS
jgi:flap endonuclease-1